MYPQRGEQAVYIWQLKRAMFLQENTRKSSHRSGICSAQGMSRDGLDGGIPRRKASVVEESGEEGLFRMMTSSLMESFEKLDWLDVVLK